MKQASEKNSNITFVDYDRLMELTEQGKRIYQMIFPNLRALDSTKFERILNPFYPDENADLSISKDNNTWKHKDWGEPDLFIGDSIDMAALYYKMDRKKEFAKLLKMIATDLKLKQEDFLSEKICSQTLESGYCLREIDWWEDGDPEGLEAAFTYFSPYGISREVLKKYCVRTTKSAYELDENGRIRVSWFPKKETVIVYYGCGFCKLYRPMAERSFKFRWLGSKPQDYVFGENQILTDTYKTKNYERGTLIITGGEKDVLTLASLGYDAITLNSETANLPAKLKEGIFNWYNKIVILYDIDETGRKNALKLASENQLAVCTLPDELQTKGGKDVSDYVQLSLSIDELRRLIAECGPIVSEPPVKCSVNPEIEQKDCLHADQSVPVGGQPDIEPVDMPIGGTPTLPDQVYNLLPQTLTPLCSRFQDRRDKDVCLLSCLTVMSSCFPSIKGFYDHRPVGCNFYLFVTAPASAGKGIMSWSRILGKEISKHLAEKYRKDYRRYQERVSNYEARKKDNPHWQRPEEPHQPRFFIPANSSSTSVSEFLAANQNFGIIFDTEGDTLSSTLKNEWADFSTTIRQAFHNEPVSYARRLNKEFREVERPHLSLLLSGTPKQITRLIDSVEDGLFSRFLFYDFEAELTWKDKFGTGDTTVMDDFIRASNGMLKYWLAGEKHGTTFILSDAQRGEVFEYFTKKLQGLHQVYGEDIVGSVRRTCLIFYKIAMVLTAVGKFEIMNPLANNFEPTTLIPDRYFRCALLIVDTLLDHLEVVFTRLQKTAVISKLNYKQQSLYASLPDAFTWQDFVQVAKELGIQYEATQKYRKDFIKYKLIISQSHGHYKKVK